MSLQEYETKLGILTALFTHYRNHTTYDPKLFRRQEIRGLQDLTQGSTKIGVANDSS